MTREELGLVSATAKLLQVLPIAEREAMLRYSAEFIRSTLAEVHADLSSREIEARVRRHIAAIRERLGEPR